MGGFVHSTGHWCSVFAELDIASAVHTTAVRNRWSSLWCLCLARCVVLERKDSGKADTSEGEEWCKSHMSLLEPSVARPEVTWTQRCGGNSGDYQRSLRVVFIALCYFPCLMKAYKQAQKTTEREECLFAAKSSTMHKHMLRLDIVSILIAEVG